MDLRTKWVAVAVAVCASACQFAGGVHPSPRGVAPSKQPFSSSLPLMLGFTLFPKTGKGTEESMDEGPEESDDVQSLKAEIDRLQSELDSFHNIQYASLVRYQAMFAEMPLPCFTLNDEGHVMEWNKAAAELFGLSASEVVDKPIKEVLGKYFFFGRAEESIYLVFMGYSPQPLDILIEIGSERKSVTWFPSPIKDSSGRVVGVVNTLAIVSSRSLGQASGQ